MSKDAMPAAADQPPAPYKNPVDDIISVLPAGLTPEEIDFIYNVEILDMPARAAAARAGVSKAKIVAPHIVQSRELVRRAFQQTLVITRADIVQGYQEAIHMAKIQGDALTTMIGWEKTAKILGLEQPTKIDVNLTASMDVLQKNVKGLTDAELMAQLGAGAIIDAEFYPVDEKADGQD